MKKGVVLIVGNITFNHFNDNELSKFKNPKADIKALVHEIDTKVLCHTIDEATRLGELALENCAESYLVEDLFSGEVVFECESNNLPIDPISFINEYLI